MKEYVVHTTLSDEEFDKRVNEMDFSAMLRESAQFVYDDMMKHLQGSDEDILSSTVSARTNYGGAYDIDPYQYFTTDELLRFGDDVATRLSHEMDATVVLSDTYIVDYNRLVLEFMVDDEIELDASIILDMRKIRRPNDIYKYEDGVVEEVESEYQQYTGHVMEGESVMSDFSSEMAEWRYLNEEEYDSEPTDVFDAEEVIEVHIDSDLVVDRFGQVDWVDTKWARATENASASGDWVSERFGFVFAYTDDIVEDATDVLLPQLPSARGQYHVVADVELTYVIEDIEYWPKHDPAYEHDSDLVTLNFNKSKVLKVDVVER